jgi:hypothetical protein
MFVNSIIKPINQVHLTDHATYRIRTFNVYMCILASARAFQWNICAYVLMSLHSTVITIVLLYFT